MFNRNLNRNLNLNLNPNQCPDMATATITATMEVGKLSWKRNQEYAQRICSDARTVHLLVGTNFAIFGHVHNRNHNRKNLMAMVARRLL